MARDDFTTRVIERLRARVAHRCSNPDCRVPTVAPGSMPDAVTSIGVAAHIHAASPGGPRYVMEMTPAARSSIDNAIWLCSGCSIKIDRDVTLYSADKLRGWKASAEDQALKELGKPLPSASDASNQVAMALTGLPVAFAPTAIANVHMASRKVLEQLDPRFRVETSHLNDMTTVSLHAKEVVPFSFRISATVAAEWRTQLAGMVDHGTPAAMKADGVQLRGSPLLEMAFPAEGRIVLTPHGRQAVMKVSVVDPSTQQVVTLDDLRGELSGGRKSFNFAGGGMGGLLEMSIRKPIAEDTIDADFSLLVDLERWVGKDVRVLPYFEKISQLYSRVLDGWQVDVRLEVDGMYLLGGRISLPRDDLKISATHVILEYTRRARIVATELKQVIQFRIAPAFTAADHANLAEIVDIIERREVARQADLGSNIECTLTVGDGGEQIELLASRGEPQLIVVEQPANQPLVVFGQPVVLPSLKTTLSGVVPKIIEVLPPVNGKTSVRVEWVPVEGFELTRRFVGEDSAGGHGAPVI